MYKHKKESMNKHMLKYRYKKIGYTKKRYTYQKEKIQLHVNVFEAY